MKKKLFLLPLVMLLAMTVRGDISRAGVLDDLEKETVALAAKIRPSLVTIEATGWQQPAPAQERPRGNRFGDRLLVQKAPLRSSGVIVSKEGHIVTVGPQLAHAGRIKVTLHDGKTYPAKRVGVDRRSGLALLKIEPKEPLKPATFGNSKALQVGSWVLAAGDPFRLGLSVSVGIVSGLDRKVGGRNAYKGLIQTSASINPGDSGGMLVNTKGELIGILSATYGRAPSRHGFQRMMKHRRRGGMLDLLLALEPAEADAAIGAKGEFDFLFESAIEANAAIGAEGINFAIPIDDARKIIDRLKEGKVREVPPMLGVFIVPVGPALASHLGLKEGQGSMITRVREGSVAQKAGLKRYDVIVKVGDTTIDRTESLRKQVQKAKPGVAVTIHLIRAGKPTELKIVLRPEAPAPPTEPAPERP